MDPQTKSVFIDVHKWVRANEYVASPEEVAVLKESTIRVRRYALGGFGASAGLAWAGIRRIAPKLNSAQSLGFAVCSGLMGGFSGLSVCVQTRHLAKIHGLAGPICLKQLVALPNSPMADEARRVVMQRKEFVGRSSYIQAFPPGALLQIQNKLEKEAEVRATSGGARRQGSAVDGAGVRGSARDEVDAGRGREDGADPATAGALAAPSSAMDAAKSRLEGLTPSERRERIIRQTLAEREAAKRSQSLEASRAANDGGGGGGGGEGSAPASERPAAVRRMTGGRRLLPWEERELYPGPRPARQAAAYDNGGRRGGVSSDGWAQASQRPGYGAPKLNAYGDPV